MRLPERDQLSVTREKMKADLAVAMGGRVAEEIIFGHDKVTSGATSDISMATKMARAMVTRYGFSEKLGPLEYGENEEEVFLGHSVARQQSTSEATAQIIDQEVRRIVDEGYEKAREVLKEHIDELHLIAKSLLEYETLSGDEIKALLRGENLDRPEDRSDDSDAGQPAKAKGATVPSTGRKPRPGGSAAGSTPEPQPGS